MTRKKKSMIGVDPLAWLAEADATESESAAETEATSDDANFSDDKEADTALNKKDQSTTIILNEIQDISKSSALRNDIISMINEVDMLTINAEKVDRIDGSALQVLCGLFIYAKENNLMIAWLNPSEAIVRAAKISGVDALLELTE